MALGSGKYDDQCTKAREKTQAETVILIVFKGNKGAGFSVQTTNPLALLTIPGVLREIADSVEKDIANDAGNAILGRGLHQGSKPVAPRDDPAGEAIP